MSKLSFRGRKRPDTAVEPARQQWRTKADGPINLTARPSIDSAAGQKAFVLAFAAVAVAGSAYFATMMLSPEIEPSVISEANARPQEVQAAVAPPLVPAAPKQAEVKVAAVAPVAATATAAPALPDPVRVKSVTIPKVAAAPAAVEPAPETQIAAIEEPEAPIAANAYATDDGLVNEGIEAVMGIVAKEAPALAPKAAKKKQEQEVAEAQPEMAGGSAARKIRTAVTMRAKPAQGGAAIGTIPTNASVTVAPGCKSWCQVSYEGKRGYIYKGFLR